MTPLLDYLTNNKNYNDDIIKIVHDITSTMIEKIEESKKNNDGCYEQPSILLGNIQAGKTMTFIGVIALAFDLYFDVCFILTKNCKALAKQTITRLEQEFADPCKSDYLNVYDIMSLPTPLTKFILGQKLIIVVKKEKKNLERLVKCFTDYSILRKKNILIVDDEADFTSITYRKNKEMPDGIELGEIAKTISLVREQVTTGVVSFFQVTATPYSLFLQEEDIEVNGIGYKPIYPSTTHVLEPHDKYVGGKVYFEDSKNSSLPAFHIYESVDEKELDRLTVRKGITNRRETLKKNILTTQSLQGFRTCIISYLVGGSIRCIQENIDNVVDFFHTKKYKSSCLIHIDMMRYAHDLQEEYLNEILQCLKQCISDDIYLFEKLLKAEYDKYVLSITKAKFQCPSFSDVVARAKKALLDDEISCKVVNSDNQVVNLLDRSGQLKLDNPFNIFIGGQVLDRGITIENLIMFFYGRSPKKFSMDTVLQHCRMYGARKEKDVAVTRLFTSPTVYDVMENMYFFDKALRDSCKNNTPIKFIQRSKDGTIVPCSPNKILNSEIKTLKSYTRLLPIGFQIKKHNKLIVAQIDAFVETLTDSKNGTLVDREKVIEVIRNIAETHEQEKKDVVKWNVDDFIATLNYATESHKKVHVFVRTGRNISRKKGCDIFTDAPDDGNQDLKQAKKLAVNHPVLMLLKQEGKKDKGWTGSSFYWPVLILQKNIETCVFTCLKS